MYTLYLHSPFVHIMFHHVYLETVSPDFWWYSCSEITSHRFFEVMSAFTMFDEYFLKDLGNDQAIWGLALMFHMGVFVQSPRCKSQLTTALLFPLKRNKKGIRGETTWRNTCTMSLSCNCCWGILWDYCILFVVSAIRHLSKLKCHTVAKKKRQLRLVNLVES